MKPLDPSVEGFLSILALTPEMHKVLDTTELPDEEPQPTNIIQFIPKGEI